MKTTTTSGLVLTDGGPREGLLVLADGALVAVFAYVLPEETAGGDGPPEGWFLEGGFGPCSTAMVTPPEVFPSMEEALAWVEQRLKQRLLAGDAARDA